jgi:hypothetical protein
LCVTDESRTRQGERELVELNLVAIELRRVRSRMAQERGVIFTAALVVMRRYRHFNDYYKAKFVRT